MRKNLGGLIILLKMEVIAQFSIEFRKIEAVASACNPPTTIGATPLLVYSNLKVLKFTSRHYLFLNMSCISSVDEFAYIHTRKNVQVTL